MIVLYFDTLHCDARCYNAKSSPEKCICICGGKNHGVGLSKAWNENQRQMIFKIFPVKGKIKRKSK